MDQRAVEWQHGVFCRVDLNICDPCWEDRKHWITAGIRGAVERQRKAQKLAGDFT